MSRVNISILIVSFNTCEMTCDCIRSIYKQAIRDNFEIIVVDNNSKDGSADAIASEFSQVKLIRSRENTGFAKANNLAASEAQGSYLLLLNPDTVILDNAIDRLLDFAQTQPNARIWGGRSVFGDGSLNPKSCWRFMSLWSLLTLSIGLTKAFPNTAIFNREGYGGWYRDTIREVDIVTGCFLLIDRMLWDNLGGFDESFFMYGEEADLCYRARRLGACPTTTPDATIIHYGGASEKIFSDQIVRLFSGKIHFLRKHWSFLARSLGITLFKLSTAVRALAFSSATIMTKNEKYHGLAREWKEVWLRRHEWTKGYSNHGR